MSETQKSTQSNTTIPTDHAAQSPTEQAVADAEEEMPTVTELFTIFGEEYRVLPYDADAVCQAVLDVIDQSGDDIDVGDAQAIAKLAESCTGVTFPDLVVMRAEITLQNEYSTTSMTTLLHLMSAHGKSILDENSPVEAPIPVEQETTQPRKTQAFITVRALRLRTEKAIRHLGATTKRVAARSTTRTKSLFTWNRQ